MTELEWRISLFDWVSAVPNIIRNIFTIILGIKLIMHCYSSIQSENSNQILSASKIFDEESSCD